VKKGKSGTNEMPPWRAAQERQDPIAVIMQHHEGQLALCDGLERIADSLPHQIDIAQCLEAIDKLEHLVRHHHRFEETGLFPLLRRRAPGDPHLQRSLDRLEQEHRTDEGYVDEVLDVLSEILRGRFAGTVDVAGYMLRGLFESLRRHIALENDYVLPLARRLLTEEDRARLRELLSETWARP
jgi:hemerythrin-like domain-containing protein